MKLTPIDQYIYLIKEINSRLKVVNHFSTNEGYAVYDAAKIEIICLQIRKILEIIAFSSLVANKEAYAEAYQKFATNWNAKMILNDLEKVNLKFYPTPLRMPESNSSDKKILLHLSDNYLTKDKFVKVYEMCGSIMHAKNPYGSKTDFKAYEENIPIWINEIVNLIRCHQVKLLDIDNSWLIIMKEVEVHAYVLDHQM